MQNVSQRFNQILNSYPRYHALNTLDLRSNEIKENGIQHLADALRNNTTLIELTLYGIKFGEKGAQHIADSMRHNTTLTTLDLSDSKIGDKGIQHVADSLRNNTVNFICYSTIS
ncbi:unnamed protein product [Adineta steineri]|uniref:Uncharacterized protein n=1 Tax=Adineta steineri TaxID=433720 RepID=A0A819A4V1_9BILA|nr:unnamed protein product [Adineta steineri]